VANSSGGGHCEGAGQCNATNCAGCCSGDLCVEGAQNIACGSYGDACQNCTDGGGECVIFDVDGFDDGGVGQVCGYDCPGMIPICGTYCSKPSDCFGPDGPGTPVETL
jgi:hypothetical protein